jgi:hypothetical protein
LITKLAEDLEIERLDKDITNKVMETLGHFFSLRREWLFPERGLRT